MSDQKLLDLVRTIKPASVAEAVALMEQIDAELALGDGLKWFNFLYSTVTREIRNNLPASGWASPAWIMRLDVIFAGFYFSAIEQALKNDPHTPRSWDALFDSRHAHGIDRIQFALAGMNAHINHDLALALIETNKEFGIEPGLASPEHQDYEHINDLLEAVMPTALHTLAAGTGIIGALVEDSGKVGRLLAIWSVRAARDLAWDFANHLMRLDRAGRAVLMAGQDGITGALGKSLLLPI